MPMDFRRSFAWKPRKGVSGYELKLGHRWVTWGWHALLLYPAALLRCATDLWVLI